MGLYTCLGLELDRITPPIKHGKSRCHWAGTLGGFFGDCSRMLNISTEIVKPRFTGV